MIPITAAVSGKLSWSRLSCFSGSYELKVNEQVAGTLTRPSLWSSKLIATIEGEQWAFRRAGWLGSGAEILDASDQPIATYKTSWNRTGTLTFADGQKFSVRMNGWFRPTWSIVTESGHPVALLHTRGREIELPQGVTIPSSRLSLLILFALNCILLTEEDAAGAAVVAATS